MLTEIVLKYACIGLAVTCIGLTASTFAYKLSRDSSRKDVAVQTERVKNVEKSLDVEKANRSVLTNEIERQNKEIVALNTQVAARKADIAAFEASIVAERVKSMGLSSELRRLRAIPTEDNCKQADQLFNTYR